MVVPAVAAVVRRPLVPRPPALEARPPPLVPQRRRRVVPVVVADVAVAPPCR